VHARPHPLGDRRPPLDPARPPSALAHSGALAFFEQAEAKITKSVLQGWAEDHERLPMWPIRCFIDELAAHVQHRPALVVERLELGKCKAELEGHAQALPLPRNHPRITRRMGLVDLAQTLLRHRRHVVRVLDRLDRHRRVTKLAPPVDLPVARRGNHCLTPYLIRPSSSGGGFGGFGVWRRRRAGGTPLWRAHRLRPEDLWLPEDRHTVPAVRGWVWDLRPLAQCFPARVIATGAAVRHNSGLLRLSEILHGRIIT
jgi:hypothetical protein